MSDINKLDLTRLKTPEDTARYFDSWGDRTAIGLELEQQIVLRDDTQTPLDLDGNRGLEEALAKIGQPISQEASSQTIEIKTDAYGPGQTGALLSDIFNQQAKLHRVLAERDLEASPHSILPKAAFPELLENIHTRPRSQVFLRHFQEHDRLDIARYFTTVSGVQTSMSPKDAEHGFEYYRRMAYLLPVLADALHTVPGETLGDDGAAQKTERNLSLERRLAPYGIDKALPDAFWNCGGDAETFLKGCNEAVWDTELFCYFTGPDPEADLHYVEDKDDIKRFRDLPEEHRTVANFQLAHSIQWYLVRLSPLQVNEDTGCRVELAFLDNGNDDNVKIAAALSDALAYNEDFQKAVDAIARTYGFDDAPDARTKALWTDTLKSVVEDHGDTSRIRYGTATLDDARADLAAAVASVLDDHPELEPLRAKLSPARSQPEKRRAGQRFGKAI